VFRPNTPKKDSVIVVFVKIKLNKLKMQNKDKNKETTGRFLRINLALSKRKNARSERANGVRTSNFGALTGSVTVAE
jgi:hypothetical protein